MSLNNKMKMMQKFKSSMSMNVIGGLIGLLLIFGIIVCTIGNRCMVSAFENEYSNVTYHMANTAAMFVNGNHVKDYINGEYEEEYRKSKLQLDICAQKLNVSIIYVILVDRSDYGRFVSVFNAVNNSVGNTKYIPWELGYERNTTNEEYRGKYKALYEKEVEYETVFRIYTTDGQLPHITTLVPIKDAAGDVSAILCIQRPMSEMSEAFRPYILLTIVGVFFMVVLVSILATIFIKNSIIKPVEKVSMEATRFAKEGVTSKPLGKLSKYEVISNLANSIDSMEVEMLNYIDNITTITAEREKIGAELSIAATIQSDSLPNGLPSSPLSSTFDIFASMDPAKEVGGDFYNYFMIDDEHLGIVIADVSGKGIPAALFMMVTSILVSNRAKTGESPADVLSYVNDDICQHNKAEMFETIWLGVLDLTTGKIIYTNAGHEDPVLYRKNANFGLCVEKHDFVIGGMEGVKYKNHELILGEGDKLFLYTDGLPEANDKDNNMFTIKRMLNALNDNKEKSPKEIINGISESVNEFVREAPQFDDLTMLCIEYKGKNTKEE